VRTCTNVTSKAPVADDTIVRARRSSLDGLLREVFPMARMRTILVSLTAAAFLFALAAQGQDEPPSLGDVARQARQQKQQKDAAAKDASSKDTQSKDTAPKDAPAKDAQTKDALTKDAQAPKTKKVITNEEIPEHIGPTHTLPSTQTPGVNDPQPNYGNGNPPAEYWKSQIQAQKNAISSLESQIANLTNSIQYAGANCVANCVQWNERQQQKQQQVDAMKEQLDQQQKRLEDMQDMARKQGFGSSVYDP
jgi:hypothetical protein